jgi:multicomponent Na+:H+ antiporter subunit B
LRSRILITTARLLVALMLLFSVFLLVRGHDEPGGGFLGGLIAAASFVLYVLAEGPGAVRAALRFDPRAVAFGGIVLALGAGLVAAFFGDMFFMAQWTTLVGLEVGTPFLFDCGVYLAVVGSVCTLVIALEEDR